LRNFKTNASGHFKAELADFIAANQSWLEDYALFAALKDHHAGASWDTWSPISPRINPQLSNAGAWYWMTWLDFTSNTQFYSTAVGPA